MMVLERLSTTDAHKQPRKNRLQINPTSSSCGICVKPLDGVLVKRIDNPALDLLGWGNFAGLQGKLVVHDGDLLDLRIARQILIDSGNAPFQKGHNLWIGGEIRVVFELDGVLVCPVSEGLEVRAHQRNQVVSGFPDDNQTLDVGIRVKGGLDGQGGDILAA